MHSYERGHRDTHTSTKIIIYVRLKQCEAFHWIRIRVYRYFSRFFFRCCCGCCFSALSFVPIQLHSRANVYQWNQSTHTHTQIYVHRTVSLLDNWRIGTFRASLSLLLFIVLCFAVAKSANRLVFSRLFSYFCLQFRDCPEFDMINFGVCF